MSNDKLATAQPTEMAPATLLATITTLAADPRVSPEKMAQILAIQERAEANAAKRAYMQAMAELQAELEPIAKSGHNPYLQSRYVKLEDLLAVCKPLFDKYGFAPTFDSVPHGADWIQFTCEMMHKMGHSEVRRLALPIDGTGSKGGKSQMNAIQSVGSTTSYARRYLLEMHLNLSRKDDDNDGAGAPVKVSEAQAKQVADMLDKLPEDQQTRFFKFMSLGQPKEIQQAADIEARDFKRALSFFTTPTVAAQIQAVGK